MLFDLGPDDTFIENAKKLNIDIKDIDIVIISHGHKDY
ncbi:MBL fold metallo-hydrolase [Clostridium baratii]|nr:MBL fold metallo-hydrolase [Clostridium baratii]